MRLSLAYYPDPILRKAAERVNHIDDSLRQLVYNMVETMHINHGIGLAAPQVFYSLSLFVTCVPIQNEEGKWIQGENRVFINPKILSCSLEQQISKEGCLSIPQIPITLQRPMSIQIQAVDLTGQVIEETLKGLHAANFLHEYDHLTGTLIIDYLNEEERQNIEAQLEQIKVNFPIKTEKDTFG